MAGHPVTQPLHVWQRAAVALDEFACGYGQGRSKDDPVYLGDVTEGRDYGAMRARYSSCGDRFHWRQYRLGVRESWINRRPNYRVGQNISLISGLAWASGYGKPLPEHVDIEIGDELLIWNAPAGSDAHSLSVIGIELDGARRVLRTANYGAGGMSPGASPGARLGSGQLVWKQGPAGWGHYYGARRLQRIVRLSDIVAHVTAPPNLAGASMTGEDLDALELGWK